MRIRVAARPSRLSVRQVEIVMEFLSRRLASLSYELVPVTTHGDRVRDKPLHLVGGKGLFEGEVDKAVLEGRADVAVHSMKDLPSRLPEGLSIVAVAPRGPVEDSLVPRMGLPPLRPSQLPDGTLVAAGSPRRQHAILLEAPGARLTWIRGNIDTRLRKLDAGAADYLLTAEAGLVRLGIERPRRRLPVVPYTPAPGQGIIAVVAPVDTSIARLLASASHRATEVEARAERSFLEALGGGCSKPVGALAQARNGVVEVLVAVYGREGASWYRVRHRDPEEAGVLAAEAARSSPWW